jgi:hypothetical protein
LNERTALPCLPVLNGGDSPALVGDALLVRQLVTALLLGIDAGFHLGRAIQDCGAAGGRRLAHAHWRQRAVQVVARRGVVDRLRREVGGVAAVLAVFARADFLLDRHLRRIVHARRLHLRARRQHGIRVRRQVFLLVVRLHARGHDRVQKAGQGSRVGWHARLERGQVVGRDAAGIPLGLQEREHLRR